MNRVLTRSEQVSTESSNNSLHAEEFRFNPLHCLLKLLK